MLKKFLIFTFIITLFMNSVFANESIDAETKISTLMSMYIVQGDYMGELNLGEDITRAEMITVVERLFRPDSYIRTWFDTPPICQFSDVNTSDWFNVYVYFWYYDDMWRTKSRSKWLLFGGETSEIFEPYKTISKETAVKFMLQVLHYEVIYPYTTPDPLIRLKGDIIESAKEWGLTDGIELNNLDANISRREFFVMAYNALYLDIPYTGDYASTETGYVKLIKLREMYLSPTDDLNIS